MNHNLLECILHFDSVKSRCIRCKKRCLLKKDMLFVSIKRLGMLFGLLNDYNINLKHNLKIIIIIIII